MFRKVAWLTLSSICLTLLALFFGYPFAVYVFIPLTVLLFLATIFSPPLGLGLFLLTTLTTLQLPILLDLPYFAGPEPGLLAVLAALGIRNLFDPSQARFPSSLVFLLSLYAAAIAASAFLLWLRVFSLPDGWPTQLTWDAVSKIFFWRWGNPLNLFRMLLLFLEGLGAFLIAAECYRREARRTLQIVLLAFLALGTLLAGYSVIELLLRGKELSLFPGFGPVFNDRNAYAAFWVMVCPLVLGLAVSQRIQIRIPLLLLGGGTWIFCVISLSISGILSIFFSTVVFSLMRWKLTGFPKVQGKSQTLLAALVLIAAAAGGGQVLSRFDQRISSRFGERVSFWLPALEMIKDQPILGLGPGEFYRLIPIYRKQIEDLPKSGFEHENAHNYYLQLASETGLLGALSFVGFLGFVLFRGFRYRPEESAGALPEGSAKRFSTDRLLALMGSCSPPTLVSALLAALAGLALLSITQHPLLRFVFQIYFWILAGLLASLTIPEVRVRSSRAWLSATLIVAGCALAQWILTPSPPLKEFCYGLQETSSPTGMQMTEGIAFVRRPAAEEPIELTFRGLSNTVQQSVRISLNGQEQVVQVSGIDSAVLPVGSKGIDLGIKVTPILPHAFPDSWGAGVYLTGLEALPE